jgi:predicted RND superfamily exporter protein
MPKSFIFDRVREQLVTKTSEGYFVTTFFPDEISYVSKMAKIAGSIEGSFIVSRKALSSDISASIASETSRLAILALLLIISFIALLLRNLKLTILAMLPVLSAVICVFAVFSIVNVAINATTIIAAMLVIGLCINYGVFMAYSQIHNLDTDTPKAVWVSAFTTIAGALALLFAKHPVLFSMGLTLTSGLAGGCLCAETLIPPLYRVWVLKKPLPEKVS